MNEMNENWTEHINNSNQTGYHRIRSTTFVKYYWNEGIFNSWYWTNEKVGKRNEMENETNGTERLCVCVSCVFAEQWQDQHKEHQKQWSNECRIDEYYAQIDYHEHQSTLDWSSVTNNLDKWDGGVTHIHERV